MDLDLTTFFLEIVNFLVLLWLLTRFLYRPLQAAMTARQQQAEAASRAWQAQQTQLAAERQALAQERSAQVAAREQTLRQLTRELETERSRRLAALQSELDGERSQAEARLAAQLERQRRQQDEAAARQADAFLRGYLQRLAGPELEGAIVTLFLRDLAALPADQRQRLTQNADPAEIELATAFAAGDNMRAQVEAALSSLFAAPPTLRWQREPALLAGLALRLDGYVLEASLAKALDVFRAAQEQAA